MLRNLFYDFFRKKNILIPTLDPTIAALGRIRIERDKVERGVSIDEFATLVGASFIPYIAYEKASIAHYVSKRLKKLHKQGYLPREQLWLGVYYKKEIKSLFFPDVVVRWIDDVVGWGVFAARTFKKGDFISEYAGKIRRRKFFDMKNAYCFEYVLTAGVSTSYVIDGQDQGGIGRLINHSSRPNIRSQVVTCDWSNHVILTAEETISTGTQLLYDYGDSYWSKRTLFESL